MSTRTIKQILKDKQLAPSKKLGQNFLIHRQTAERIVVLAGVTTADTVVELGVGLGSLTGPLAAAVDHVIGLEIDAGIIAWQQSEGNLPANVTLIHQDLLEADFTELAERCGGRLKIVANLPYSISNPLLFKLLDNRAVMAWAVLMLQKEVAMRLVASPGTKEYGILSVRMAGAAKMERLLDVGPGQFHPRPKVDSQVVRIVFDPPPDRVRSLPPHDGKLLARVVRAAFGQRRKTLLNALAAGTLPGETKESLLAALDRAAIAPTIRAEQLTIEHYVALTRELAKNLSP
ncbi:MAG: 16S rRNA (adenine(1518)-N(6)/adenine(1519)-N(6))-dimethyltransferase RsmA [Thermodesulfobacteriota bacterium]